jgi:hypothetical protein
MKKNRASASEDGSKSKMKEKDASKKVSDTRLSPGDSQEPPGGNSETYRHGGLDGSEYSGGFAAPENSGYHTSGLKQTGRGSSYIAQDESEGGVSQYSAEGGHTFSQNETHLKPKEQKQGD